MAIVEIKGLDEIQNALNKLRLQQDEVDDLLKEAVLRPIYNATSEAFENETSPFGDKWKELSEERIDILQNSKKDNLN